MKLLIIDDKKAIGNLFELTVGQKGHTIKWYDDLDSALQAVQNEPFDLAFVDMIMPKTNGVEILKAIKARVPQLPIIAMSGYLLDEQRREAIQLGIAGWLKKPFEVSELQKAIFLATGEKV